MASAGDGRQHLLYLRSVSPHFLETLRVPVLAGRGIGDDDRREAPRVVVINDQFRKDVFGDIDPIGRVLTFNFRQRSEDADYQAVVVGVVGSIRHTSLAAPPFREAYMPEAQSPGLSYDLVVRSRIDPHAIAAPMRTAIWSVDADQGIGSMRTFEDVVDGGLSQPRFRGHLLAAFALAGLALAAVGLYGLLGARVDQGRREIGIRMAMGASPQALLRLILGRGMTLTLGGIVIGLSGSLLFSRLLSTLVFGIAATDPATFASGATVLALAGFAASYLPARRATRLDPVVALRHE